MNSPRSCAGRKADCPSTVPVKPSPAGLLAAAEPDAELAKFLARQFRMRLTRSTLRPDAEFRLFVRLYRVPTSLQDRVRALAEREP